MEPSACIVCFSSDMRYNDEQFRQVCNICETMQPISGIGITSYEGDPNVKFDRLPKFNLKRKSRLNIKLRKRIKLETTLPWNLPSLFKWIFDKQVAAMQPYVVDWYHFRKLADAIWMKYSDATGMNYDILQANNDDIKLKRYPIGWGSNYNPKDGANLLSQATREFYRLKREDMMSDSNSDEEYFDKIDRNADKIRIERMVHMKRLDKKASDKLEMTVAKDENTKNGVIGVEKMELKDEKSNLAGYLSDESSDVESCLPDEDEPSYIQFDLIDTADEDKVRILRKKNMHDVLWCGSFNITKKRYMENNIVLLFLSLYYSRHKKPDCCCMMDILRLVRDMKIPYIRMRRYIPSQLFFVNDTTYHTYLLRQEAPAWNVIMVTCHRILRDLKLTYLIKFDLDMLIRRIVRDLNLPGDLCHLIDFIRFTTEKFHSINRHLTEDSDLIKTKLKLLRYKYPFTIFPEPFCIAYVFIALRIMMKLDGVYELQVSDLVKKLEKTGRIETGKLFVWTDWWQDMYRAPSLSTCKTWDDLDEVGDSLSFLEDFDIMSTNNKRQFLDLGLEVNEDLNHRGRVIRDNVTDTRQEVLDDTEEPLRAIFGAVKDSIPPRPPMRDFTNTDIKYLLKPQEFACRITDAVSQNKVDEPSQSVVKIVNELVKLVSSHDLSMARISLVGLTFNDDVFSQRFSFNLNEIEDKLLRIMTLNTGFNKKDVFQHISKLEKYLIEKTKKRKNKFL